MDLEIQRREDEIYEKSARLRAIERELAKLKEEINTRKTRLDAIKADIEDSWPIEKEAKAIGYKGELDRLKNEIDTRLTSVNTLQTEARDINTRIKQLEAELDPYYKANPDALARPLKRGEVVIYSRENFYGLAQIVRGDVADLNPLSTVRSLRVGPGTGVTVYETRDFQGISQQILADMPNFSVTRLGGKLPQALRTWKEAKQQFTGRWVIQTSDDKYLSVEGGYLHPRSGDGGLGDAELFGIQYRSDQKAAAIRIRLVNPAAILPAPDQKPPKGQFALKKLTTFVPLPNEGRGCFALITNSGHWLGYRPNKGTFFKTMDFTQREIFRLKIAVADDESQLGPLQSGQVALYENAGYWGRAVVLDEDTEDLRLLRTWNTLVSSIRVPERTGLTIYQQPGYQGAKEDIAKSVSDLSGSQVGTDRLHSFRVWRLVPPEKSRVRYKYSLSEHYRRMPDGSFSQISAYCVTLNFPENVKRIDIWTTDATELEVNGTVYPLVDEDANSVRVRPNLLSNLVVVIPAKGLSSPGLKIRTNAMAKNERFIIYPDRDLHEKMASLQGDALWNGEVKRQERRNGQYVEVSQPLVNQNKFAQSDVNTIQQAIQRVTSSVQYRVTEGTAGISGAAADIDYPAMTRQVVMRESWQLSFGGGAAAGASGLARTTGGTGSTGGNVTIKSLTPDEVSQLEARLQPRPLMGAAATAGTTGISAPTLDLGDILDFIKTIFDGIDFVIKAIANGFEIIVQFFEDISLKAISFIIDSAEKVALLVQGLLQKIEVAWDKFVDWLKFLFDWGDILETQKWLTGQVIDGFELAKKVVRDAKQPVRRFFNQQMDEISAAIDRGIIAVGGTPTQVEDKDPDMPEALERVLNLLFGGGGEPNPGSSELTAQDPLLKFITKVLEELYQIGVALADFFGDSAQVVLDLIKDPGHPERALAGMLQAIKEILVRLLACASDLSEAALELVADVIDRFQKMLTAALDIPLVADFYKWVTQGGELTLLNVATLLVAIPATVMMKAIDAAAANTSRHSLTSGAAAVSRPQALDPKISWKIVALVSDFINTRFVMGLGAVPEGTDENVAFSVLEGISLVFGFISWLASFPGSVPGSYELEAEKGSKANKLVIPLWGIKTAFFWLDVGVYIVALVGKGKFEKLKLPQRLKHANNVTFFVTSLKGLLIMALSAAIAAQRDDKKDKKARMESAQDIIETFPDIFAPLRMQELAKATEGGSHIAMVIVDGLCLNTKIGLQTAILAEEAK